MISAGTPSDVRTTETRPPIPSIPLSIVIATTKPWPEVRGCLDSLHSQARFAGAEIIVADGHGRGLAEDGDASYPDVVWLKKPHASVFVLRGLAMARARGALVAVTEDHCRVAPDWCERIIKAHAQHPEAAAIGGAVENGATERLIDWANFLLVFAPFVLPIESGPSERICLQANISYKRHVLPQDMPELGMMEMLFNQRLHAQGDTLIADDRLLVYHVQSWGFFGTFAAHFHNGRSIAGFRLPTMGWPERVLRLGGCPLLPPVLLWRTLRPIWKKRRLYIRTLACLHLLACVVCCHAAGEFIGYLAGPGESPQRLA
ncbi:MAG: glycosyltransferase family 2 protein [Nitrospiraceae bacterium]